MPIHGQASEGNSSKRRVGGPGPSRVCAAWLLVLIAGLLRPCVGLHERMAGPSLIKVSRSTLSVKPVPIGGSPRSARGGSACLCPVNQSDIALEAAVTLSKGTKIGFCSVLATGTTATEPPSRPRLTDDEKAIPRYAQSAAASSALPIPCRAQ